MAEVRACLFDLDGVLVDTARYHYLAWKRLADELGIHFTPEDNERLKGVSRSRSLDILLELGGLQIPLEQKEELAARKNGWYVDYISRMDSSQVLPGAREFMASLRAAGIKTALGSASQNARRILESTGIKELFDAVVDGTKTRTAKPDPEVFLLGARELGVGPEECVVFEDAAAGVQAARTAGMRVVGVGTQSKLEEADLVIASFAELSGAVADELALLFGINAQTFAQT